MGRTKKPHYGLPMTYGQAKPCPSCTMPHARNVRCAGMCTHGQLADTWWNFALELKNHKQQLCPLRGGGGGLGRRTDGHRGQTAPRPHLFRLPPPPQHPRAAYLHIPPPPPPL